MYKSTAGFSTAHPNSALQPVELQGTRLMAQGTLLHCGRAQSRTNCIQMINCAEFAVTVC